MIETDALIVGAGPVGLFQVFQLGLLEMSCHVVDALPHPGGQCAELYPDKPIYDIPGIPATTGRDLVASLLAQIRPFTEAGTARLHWQQLVSDVRQGEDGHWLVQTTAGQRFLAKTLFIAAGAGAFVPRKLKVPGIERFEGTQLFYHPPAAFDPQGLHLVVQGDDDLALDWAIHWASQRSVPGQQGGLGTGAAASVTLLHRREAFTATPERVARMQALCASGAMRFVAGQLLSPDAGKAPFTALTLGLPDGSTMHLEADRLFASLGLSPRLGPLADWGLELQRKQLPVDTEKFQTNLPGIFAVGDINTYPGKKKLILCGFHECVLAAFGAAEIVFPNKLLPLQYTTTSTRLHTLLNVTVPE